MSLLVVDFTTSFVVLDVFILRQLICQEFSDYRPTFVKFCIVRSINFYLYRSEFIMVSSRDSLKTKILTKIIFTSANRKLFCYWHSVNQTTTLNVMLRNIMRLPVSTWSDSTVIVRLMELMVCVCRMTNWNKFKGQKRPKNVASNS